MLMKFVCALVGVMLMILAVILFSAGHPGVSILVFLVGFLSALVGVLA